MGPKNRATIWPYNLFGLVPDGHINNMYYILFEVDIKTRQDVNVSFLAYFVETNKPNIWSYHALIIIHQLNLCLETPGFIRVAKPFIHA